MVSETAYEMASSKLIRKFRIMTMRTEKDSSSGYDRYGW